MTNKEKFEQVLIEVVLIDSNDIIATSTFGNDLPGLKKDSSFFN